MPGRPVTAIALACTLGRTTAEVWAALRAGRTGLAPPSAPLADDLGLVGARRSAPLGVVPGDLAPLPPELAAWDTRCARLLALGLAELGPAVAKAVARYGAGRVAIVLGTSTAGIERTERAWAARATRAPDFDLERQHAFGALVEVTRAITGARGPGWVVSTACSSSAKVLGDALRLIDGGLADAVITGGVDSLCRTTLHGFAALEVLSLRGCRPFAADRDGISIGEGAGLLLVERTGSSTGADPHLLAVGESSDAHHGSAPHPDGLGARLAIEDALARAGLTAADVGHVNAHGTGTPQNDVAEAKAIRAVLPADVLVSSTKGATGHLLGAAGGVEAAFALLACVEGVVPPSLGAEPLAPDLGLRVATTTTSRPLTAALSTSLAFGGSNAVVAVAPGERGRPAQRARRPGLVVKSVGLWAPGWPSVAAWRTRTPDPTATEPPATLLPARLKRRTSLLTRLVAEVLGQTKADLPRVPVVHATAWGELQVTGQLLEALAKGEELSPAAFSGSVQNTATGTCSIALGSHAPTTTIAAGRATTAMGLLAAWQRLRDLGGELVLVVADEALGAPFDPALRAAPLAVAFHLGLAGPGALATFTDLDEAPAAEALRASAPPELAASFAAPGLSLLDAVLGGARVVDLPGHEPTHVWRVQLGDRT
jgi:3-oxoacyl-[acyl-carrier-protein] synthase-1